MIKEFMKATVAKEVKPKDTKRAEAYDLWKKATNPMVTVFRTLDVTSEYEGRI